MQTQTQTPISYVTSVIAALQWPVVVFAAFMLGRSMTKLEARGLKAEKNVSDLIERHMPHIHNALAEIKTLLLSGRR